VDIDLKLLRQCSSKYPFPAKGKLLSQTLSGLPQIGRDSKEVWKNLVSSVLVTGQNKQCLARICAKSLQQMRSSRRSIIDMQKSLVRAQEFS